LDDVVFQVAQYLPASLQRRSAESWGMPDRSQKITFAEVRDMGVRGPLIYRSDYNCSHLITMSGDRWPDDVAMSRFEGKK
jgi:hypothetical protein